MIRALDRHTGRVEWEYRTTPDSLLASFHADPLTIDGLFFIGTDGPSDDGIHALDWRTGSLRWTAPAPGGESEDSGVATDIQHVDGRLYATSLADELLCLDATDGRRVWTYPSGFQNMDRVFNGTPAVTPDVVYFGGLDGVGYAVRREDGELLWQSPLGESIRTSVCVVRDGIVMGTIDGALHLLDAGTGEVTQRLELGKEPSATIVEADGSLLVCTDWLRPGSELMCVDADLADIVWLLGSPDDTSWSTPRPYVYGDHVFVGNTRGDVLEYRIADGRLVRSTQVEGVVRGIRLVDDVLYVGNQDGMLWAIKR